MSVSRNSSARPMTSSQKRHWSTSVSLQENDEKFGRYTLNTSMLVDKAKKGKVVKEIQFPAENIGLYAVRFNSDASKIIASYGTGSIQVIDTESEIPLYIVKPPTSNSYPIVAIRCSNYAPNVFFAAGICGNIYACHFKENSFKILAREKSNEINAMDIDDRTELLASGGKDGTIRLYDTRVGKLISKLQKSNRLTDLDAINFHTRRIFSIKFHPKRQNIFLSGGWDDCVKIWDTRNANGCVRNIEGPHICGDAIDVTDSLVLTGQWTAENALQLWDFGSGKLVSNIVPTNRVQTLDGEFLFCCQFLKCEALDECVVAGGSGQSYLDIINLNDERILYMFKVNKLIQTLDSSNNGKIVYGGMDQCIRIVDFDVEGSNIFM
nr:cleavage stimulation factor subunit 1-like [Onthophagus taurus]